jgi:hypothetical protein
VPRLGGVASRLFEVAGGGHRAEEGSVELGGGGVGSEPLDVGLRVSEEGGNGSVTRPAVGSRMVRGRSSRRGPEVTGNGVSRKGKGERELSG